MAHPLRYGIRDCPEQAPSTQSSRVKDTSRDANPILAAGEAQSNWHNIRFDREEARKQWALLSPAGYVLRDEPLHDMRYGFRKNPELLLRDQAYTHLKEAVDEIRECGQYVFRKNPERGQGYASDYLGKARKALKKAEQAEKTEPSAS